MTLINEILKPYVAYAVDVSWHCLFALAISKNHTYYHIGMPTTTERAQEGIYWLAILVLEKPGKSSPPMF